MPMPRSSTKGPLDPPSYAEEPGDELDDYVRAFEQAYTQDESADLAGYLPPSDHPLYATVLRELVRVDMEYGWERGFPKSIEDYQRAFPDLTDDRDAIREIAFEEFRLRYQAGQDPSPEEYLRSFGVELDLRAGRFRSVRNQGGGVQHGGEEQRGSVRPPPGGPALPRSEVWTASNWLNTHRIGHDGATSRHLPEAGSEFLGFRLISELGRGSFGRVFLARQGEMADRPVVLKVTDDSQDESQTLAQLQHRNIVPVYSRHRAGRLRAVCMPYLGSVTLRDIFDDLKQQGNLPGSGRGLLSSLNKSSIHKGVSKEWTADKSWSTTVRVPEVVAQGSEALSGHAAERESPPATALTSGSRSTGALPTAPPDPRDSTDARVLLGHYSYVDAILWMAARLSDGLAHAHDRGILHRDIKPANVLVTEDGLPMLLDFNLAEDLKRHPALATRHAALGGTLPYMAPEHLDAFRGGLRPVDARSDLYSLGVILFEMLTGRPPFPVREGGRLETLATMIDDRQGSPPMLRPWNPAISPAVESIVRHCLEPDPENRYASAHALLEDLERHLRHQPLLHTPEPSHRERASKWTKRHPWIVGLLCLGTLGLVVGSGLGSTMAGQRDQVERFKAKDSLARFHVEAIDARNRLSPWDRDPVLQPEGIEAADRALAIFGAAGEGGSAPWWERPPASLLPAADRNQLRAEIGELFLVVAWEGSRGGMIGESEPQRLARYETALKACDRSEWNFGPDNAPQALWNQRADLLDKLGRNEGARAARGRAEAAPPSSAREHYLVGLGLVHLDQYAEALPHLESSLRLEPGNFWCLLNAGICHERLGKSSQAVGFFTACDILWPHQAVVSFNLGLIAVTRHDWQSAAEHFDRGLELRPHDPRALVERGLAALNQNQPKAAIDWFSRAMATGKAPVRTYFLSSQARQSLGDRQGAEEDERAGLGLTPHDERGWSAQGFVLQERGDLPRALNAFDQALKLDPNSEFSLINKAYILSEHLGRPAEAIELLDRILAFKPDQALFRVSRGTLQARIGRDDAARADTEAALDRNPSPEVRYRAAGTYALTSLRKPEDRHEAILHLRSALGRGYGLDRIDEDADLGSLRADPEFRRIVDRARAAKAAGPLSGKLPPTINPPGEAPPSNP